MGCSHRTVTGTLTDEEWVFCGCCILLRPHPLSFKMLKNKGLMGKCET